MILEAGLTVTSRKILSGTNLKSCSWKYSVTALKRQIIGLAKMSTICTILAN